MAVSTQQAGRPRNDAAPRPASSRNQTRNQTLATIAEVVETEIVPRLLAAHDSRLRTEASLAAAPAAVALGSAAPAPHGTPLDARFCASFVAELITADQPAIQSRISQLLQDGMSPEAVCLLALAPAARHLGELWVQDLCSFIDVTSSTALLHAIMNDLRGAFTSHPASPGSRRRAMLLTAPGEQHRFGLSMLAEFFRKESWQVSIPAATSIAQVTALGAARAIDVVGFSAGSDQHLGTLAACIAALRASAYNPDLVIMVGGPIFLARPEFAAAVGADGTASDAEQAVRCATALLKGKRAAATRRTSARSRAQATVPAAACDRSASHAPSA